MKNLFKGFVVTLLTTVSFATFAQSSEQLVANYVQSYTGCETSARHLGRSKFRVSSCGKTRNIVFSKKTRARMAKALADGSSSSSLSTVCPQQAAAVQQLAAARPAKVVYKDRVVVKEVVRQPQGLMGDEFISRPQALSYQMTGKTEAGVKIGTAVIGAVGNVGAGYAHGYAASKVKSTITNIVGGGKNFNGGKSDSDTNPDSGSWNNDGGATANDITRNSGQGGSSDWGSDFVDFGNQFASDGNTNPDW